MRAESKLKKGTLPIQGGATVIREKVPPENTYLKDLRVVASPLAMYS